jgi:hypothetical protein
MVACAPTTYLRPGASESQIERDQEACRLEGAARVTEDLPRFVDYRVDVSAFESGPYELESQMRFSAQDAAKTAYQSYFDERVKAYVTPCMARKGYTLGQLLTPRQPQGSNHV